MEPLYEPTKSIIDYFNCEDRKKENLAEISNLVYHGFDLLGALNEQRKIHPENQNHIYRTLCDFVAMLRGYDRSPISSGGENFDIKQLEKIVKLFVKEVFGIYRFPRGRDPYYASVKDYYDQLNDDEKKQKWYESTSIDKIPIPEEDEIRLLNPWGLSEYVNPIQDDSTLYDDNAQCVLRCDKDYIIEHNNHYKETNADYVYQIQKWPKPFMGNPLKSDVVLLSLNPGYKEWQKKKLAKAIEKEYRKGIVKHLRLQANLEAVSMFCPDKKEDDLAITYFEAHTLVDDYWYNMIERFRESVGIPRSSEEIDPLYTRLSVIEYVGYASKRYTDLAKERILPSQYFTRMLIQYLTLKRKTLFVVVRAEEQWKKLLGAVWGKLDDDGRLILSKKIRKQSLSKGFKKEEDYSELVKRLKY